MQRKSLVRKLFPLYFIISLLSILVVGFFSLNALDDNYFAQAEQDLEIIAKLIEPLAIDSLKNYNKIEIDRVLAYIKDDPNRRVIIYDQDGYLYFDTHENYIENNIFDENKPIDIDKIDSEGFSIKRSSVFGGKRKISKIYPIKYDDQVIGALRLIIDVTDISSSSTNLYNRITIGAILIAFFSATLSLLAATKISKPLLKIRNAAARFANGDFTSRAPIDDTEEFANLAETLNTMAAQLDNQVKTIT
ncbi:MAG: HAMP domain-containing protein, partial [Armatimonadota bacterium]